MKSLNINHEYEKCARLQINQLTVGHPPKHKLVEDNNEAKQKHEPNSEHMVLPRKQELAPLSAYQVRKVWNNCVTPLQASLIQIYIVKLSPYSMILKCATYDVSWCQIIQNWCKLIHLQDSLFIQPSHSSKKSIIISWFLILSYFSKS